MKAIGFHGAYVLMILFVLLMQFDLIYSFFILILFCLVAVIGVLVNIKALKLLVEGEPKRYPILGIVMCGIVLLFSIVFILIG